MKLHHSPLALLCVLAACSGDEGPPPGPSARPVTSMALQATSPGLDARVTGVAEPYREARVGFEVQGRLEYVVDAGQEVQGPILDENGALVLDSEGVPVQEGDILAVLDSTRYRQAAESTSLKIASSELGLESYSIELDEVLRPELDSAEAQLRASGDEIAAAERDVEAAQSTFELASANVDRDTQLVAEGVVSQVQLDTSTNDLETARARLSQATSTVNSRRNAKESYAAMAAKARGAIKLKQAQIETTKAEIAELRQTLEQKQTDLDDCVLRAPFSGRVTEIHVSRGAFVRPGSGIVTLTLLDPMQVSVSVSAENDRKLPVGSTVRVFIPGLPEEVAPGGALLGTVRSKSEVADASTRTFRLDVMVRNPHKILGDENTPTLSMDRTLPVLQQQAFGGGPMYVFPECVDDEGYVLRLPGMNPLQRKGGLPQERIVPERVRVELGTEYFNVIRWPFRQLSDPGDLQPMDILIVQPGPEHEAGVVVAGSTWGIRPHELIPVALNLGREPLGFYVPVHAISERNGSTSVFLIDGDVVSEIPVTTHEAYRDLRRIEGEGLSEGGRIVVDGAHFLADGETVQDMGAASEQGPGAR